MGSTEAVVQRIEDVGPGTVAIELEPHEAFDGAPGQFVRVTATVDGDTVDRFYTFSSPDVSETFEITVEIDPDGDFTPWLADRAVGDEVGVEGPHGSARYDDHDVVAVASGPGIGAALGMAEAAVADGNTAAIVYYDDAPVHRDRLDDLAADGATVRTGTDAPLEEMVSGVHDTGPVFVFGFQRFVDSAFDALEAADADLDDVVAESFG